MERCTQSDGALRGRVNMPRGEGLSSSESEEEEPTTSAFASFGENSDGGTEFAKCLNGDAW
jgi:hypothetical protein